MTQIMEKMSNVNERDAPLIELQPPYNLIKIIEQIARITASTYGGHNKV